MTTKKENVYAVILAGGSGTRFWPLSRQSRPKQFSSITGKATLFEDTLARVSPMVPGKNTFVVTNSVYRATVSRQAARFKVPGANILLEPEAKNTAPAIAWAAAKIHEVNPDAVMIVLPSDHLIFKKTKFLAALRQAVDLAARDFLVTLGIQPTRPETGYGYLKTALMRFKGRRVVKVAAFTEKPSLAKAQQFIKRKNYFWNSGMFVWKSDVILKAFSRHQPKIFEAFVGSPGRRPLNNRDIKEIWLSLPSISIDYGILEKADNVVTVPAADIGWSDLGSWESLMDVLDKDSDGNILKGDVISVSCRNTLVWGDQKVIAAIGVDNYVIVDTPDALLICPKDKSQAVREVVAALKARRRPEI